MERGNRRIIWRDSSTGIAPKIILEGITRTMANHNLSPWYKNSSIAQPVLVCAVLFILYIAFILIAFYATKDDVKYGFTLYFSFAGLLFFLLKRYVLVLIFSSLGALISLIIFYMVLDDSLPGHLFDGHYILIAIIGLSVALFGLIGSINILTQQNTGSPEN